MFAQLKTDKIRPAHLDRQAFIYVRQSTLAQVRHNTGSTERQYDLVQRALDLGWPREQITVIDQAMQSWMKRAAKLSALISKAWPLWPPSPSSGRKTFLTRAG